jgi:hypothetical protein
MWDEDDAFLTFSDENFERRYSPDAASSEAGPAPLSNPAAQQGQPLASRIGRSRNKFMRTLIRRRLASAAG